MTLQSSSGPVKLTDQHYAGEGGEAKVYVRGPAAYKIYHDRSDCPPKKKLEELQAIDDFHIVVPQGLLTEGGELVGYEMEAVEGQDLAKFFSRSWKKREGIEDTLLEWLSGGIVQAVRDAHDAGCVIADGNEYNWFCRSDGEACLIDADSFGTPSFSPSAFHPSTKDYTADGFTEETDWYLAAVLVMQLWTGLHPYRHGRVSGQKRDLQRRCKDLVSVFSPEVSLPKAAADFSVLPGPTRDWLVAVFEDGERIPPESAGKSKAIRATVAKGGAVTLEGPVYTVPPGTESVHVTSNRHLYTSSGVEFEGEEMPPDTQIAPYGSGDLAVSASQGRFRWAGDAQELPFDASAVLTSGQALFALGKWGLAKIEAFSMGDSRVMSLGQAWDFPSGAESFGTVAVSPAPGGQLLAVPGEPIQTGFAKGLGKVLFASSRGDLVATVSEGGSGPELTLFGGLEKYYSTEGENEPVQVAQVSGSLYAVLNGPTLILTRPGGPVKVLDAPDLAGREIFAEGGELKTLTSGGDVMRVRTS